MAKGTVNSRSPWSWADERSIVVQKPHLRLIAAMLRTAYVDLRDRDPVVALDALCFWVSADVRFWLELAGFSVQDPFSIVVRKEKIRDVRIRE